MVLRKFKKVISSCEPVKSQSAASEMKSWLKLLHFRNPWTGGEDMIRVSSETQSFSESPKPNIYLTQEEQKQF